MNHMYKDKNGNVVLAVSAPPWFTVVPPGMRRSDAVVVSDAQFKAHIDKAAAQPPGIDPLQAQINDLKNQVAALHANAKNPTSP